MSSSTVSFDDALPRILPYANGCPDQTAVFHLQQAAVEFFQRTLAWKLRLPAATTIAGNSLYGFDLPSDAVVAKVLRYEYDGRDAELVDGDVGQTLNISQASKDIAWTDDRAEFNVSPVPKEAGKLLVLQVALKPKQASMGLPALLWEQYISHIAHGALAEVLNIPSQTFTNHALAQSFRGKFEDAIGRVGVSSSKAFASARIRVKASLY